MDSTAPNAFLTEHHPSLEDPSQPCALGIDEAGRGPVLGPMIYSAAYVPIAHKAEFGCMGFADSKTLTDAQRQKLFRKMHHSKIPIGWMIEVLEPEYLSTKMLRTKKINLNTISHDAAIKLIRRALDKNVNVQEIFVDTVGPPAKYQAMLKQYFPGIEITVSKKADSLYPVVSAASIVAKVFRDQRLEEWEFKENHIQASTRFGSGYPSDPTTKAWLRTNIDPVFGFPSVLRFSWKTSEELLDQGAVDIAWTTNDLSEDKHRIKDRAERFKYFAENNMELVTEFA